MNRQKQNQNIQVYVRVRPLNSREKGIRSLEAVEVVHSKEILVQQPTYDSKVKKFTFDKSFGPDSLQVDVYNCVVAPFIQEVLAGYNCTVFAYGQTGTGKTYTMIGDENLEDKTSCEEDDMAGIIPRALNHLFDELRMLELEFSMRVSYLELYNEELCDLLSTEDTTKIRIYDDAAKKGSIIIQGLEEIPVHNKSDVYRLLAKGQERRKTASTLMNSQSSRSHTVFSIVVHIKENGIDGEEMLKIGKLNLVDLAGSENITKAGNDKGIRSRETVNINQSLLTLGRVITALVERTPHVPYRESKLTRILQESLGGKAKTSIIATISPGHKDLEETLSTLDYAHRAKNIQNKPEINQRLTKKTVLKEYTEEIDRLKRDLVAARDKNGIYLPEDTYEDMVTKLETQKKEKTDNLNYIKALKDDCMSKTKLFQEVSRNLEQTTEELEKTSNKLSEHELQLKKAKKIIRSKEKAYNETKFVLEQHVETEEKLSQQAMGVIEVAEEALKDTWNLHEAIDRRKQTEENIWSACNRFSSSVKQILDGMDLSSTKYGKKINENSRQIIEEIKTNCVGFNHFSEKLTTNLLSFSEDMQASMKNFMIQFETIAAEKVTASEQFAGEYQHQLSEMRSHQQDFQKQLISRATQLIGKAFNEYHSRSNEFCTTILNLSIANKTNVVDFTSNFPIFLRDLATEIESINKGISTEVIETAATDKNIIDGQMKLVEEFFEMFRIKNDELKSNNNKISVASGSIKDRNDTINANIGSQIEKVDKFIVELKSDKAVETKVEARVEKAQLDLSNLNQLLVESNHNATEYFMKSENRLDEIKSLGDDYLAVVKKDKDRSIELLSNESKQMSKTSSDHIQNFVNNVTNENEKINRSKNVAESFCESLGDLNKQHEISIKNDIEILTSKVDTFRMQDVRTYSNTGMTPAKKNNKLIKDLASTSPHERLLERYRTEFGNSSLDVSQAISEQSVDDSFIPNLSNMGILAESVTMDDSDIIMIDSRISTSPETENEYNQNIGLVSAGVLLSTNSLESRSTPLSARDFPEKRINFSASSELGDDSMENKENNQF